MAENTHYFRVVVVGNPYTGKTNIISRYLHDIFSTDYKVTSRVAYKFKTLTLTPKTEVRLHFWDISGHDQYDRYRYSGFSEASGAVIVFDISNRDTFKDVACWKDEIDFEMERNGKRIPVLLLANKCDLTNPNINILELDKYISEKKYIAWFATSAKDNINLDLAVKCLVKHMLEISPFWNQKN